MVPEPWLGVASRLERGNARCLPPEHVRGGGGELHLRGLEEGLADYLLSGRQQRACGGRPVGPDAGRAQGAWRGPWPHLGQDAAGIIDLKKNKKELPILLPSYFENSASRLSGFSERVGKR